MQDNAGRAAYDIIGDIHGQAAKLECLLRKLGYRPNGAWRHPERTAVFVGDFIDRGPDQLRSVEIVRSMVESGAALAVMGNHELNAIAWHTPDETCPGDFLRSRHSPEYGAKNRKQHAAFLAAVESDPERHRDIVDWFLALPLWLDLPDVRIVHACWHDRFISWLSPRLRDGRYLSRDLMPQAVLEPAERSEKDNAEPSVFKAVEAVTKGIEVPLPDGFSFRDKDGIARTRVRVRWWDPACHTYRSAAMLSEVERAQLPDSPLPAHARLQPPSKPVFFGHYWLTGAPVLQSPLAACVDYSAASVGPLVAYRFDGESRLSPDRLVCAP